MSSRVRVAACALAMSVVATGCSSASSSHRASSTAPTTRSDLVASVAQFRTDEGTPNISAGITNGSHTTIRVTSATITWDGLRFPVVKLDGAPVPPTQTTAFRISYRAAGCGEDARGDPVMVATVNGRPTRLRVKQDDPTLLRRLHVAKCAQQRLNSVATVRLELAERPVRIHGTSYLPASIVLRHRPGSSGPLQLVDLGGSVLLDLVPRAGRSALPALLPGDRRLVRFPVLFGSAHRCDGHSLGQSSQTFLLSAYVRLPGDPTQRQILVLSKQDRAALQAVIDRACHTSGR